jgi:hypothetical protein
LLKRKGFFFFFFFQQKGKKHGWLLVKTSGGHELLLPSNVCQSLRRATATKESVDVARHITVKKGDAIDVYHTADEDLGLVDALTATHAIVTVPLANLKFLDDDAGDRARKGHHHRSHTDLAKSGSTAEIQPTPPQQSSSPSPSGGSGNAGSKVARRKKRSDTAGAEDLPAPALGSVPQSGSTSALESTVERKHRHKKAAEATPAAATDAVKLCDQCHTQRAAAVVSFEGEQKMLCKQCTMLDVARRQKSGDATEVVVVGHNNANKRPTVTGQCELCHSAAAVTKTAAGKSVCAECGAVEAETDAAMAKVDAAVGVPAAAVALPPAVAAKRTKGSGSKGSNKAKAGAAAKQAGAADKPAPKRQCKQCGNPKVAARVKIDGVVELLCKECTVKRQAQYGTAAPGDASANAAAATAASKATSAPSTPAAKQGGAAHHVGGSAPTTPAVGAAAAQQEPDDAAMQADDAAMAAQAASVDWATMEPLFQKRTKFGRKLPLREVLVWSKKAIDKPLLKLPKMHEKKGEQIGAWVHEYITFDVAGGSDDATAMNAAQQALALPIRTGELRDEVYALLVRYMTQCEDRVQLWRTWQMFAMASAIFPASATMHNWLLGVVCHWRPTLGSLDERRKLRKYRKWVVEQLKALGETRSVSARTPPIDELRFYETAPLGPPSLFGCSLARALEIQREFYPKHGTKLPLVLTVCTKLIIELDGPKAQGIFRLPGNTDNIKALQLQVNKGDFALSSRPDITVHDIASLLKLWLRGLSEPLIPDSLYNKCIENPDSAKNAMDVFNALPDINKSLVARLLNFLQMIAYPENQEVNKMSLSNLSVVFAPCLLRYPMTTDTRTIMANTVKEQSFVLTLLGLPILNVVDDDATSATPSKTDAAPASSASAVTSGGSSVTHKVRRAPSARPTPAAREAPASTTAASHTDDSLGRMPANASPLISRLQSRIGDRGGRSSRSASVGSAADAAMLGVQLPIGALVAEASPALPAPAAAAAAPPELPPATAAVVAEPGRRGSGKGKRAELDEKAEKAEKAGGDAVSSAKKKTTSLGKVAAQDAAAAAQARADRSLKKKAANEAAEAAQARAAGALKKKLAESREADGAAAAASSTTRRSSKASLKRSDDVNAVKSPEKSVDKSSLKGAKAAAAATVAAVVAATDDAAVPPSLPSDDGSSVSSSDGAEFKRGSTIEPKRRDSSGSRISTRKSSGRKGSLTPSVADDALPPPLPATDERPPQTPRPELPPVADESVAVEPPATPVAAAVTAAVKSPEGTPQAPPMFADDDDDDDAAADDVVAPAAAPAAAATAAVDDDDSDASTSSTALPPPATAAEAVVAAFVPAAAAPAAAKHADDDSSSGSTHVANAADAVVVAVTPVVAVQPVAVAHHDDDESSSGISIGDHDDDDDVPAHVGSEPIVLVEVEPVSDLEDSDGLSGGGSFSDDDDDDDDADDDDDDDGDDDELVEFAQPVALRASGVVAAQHADDDDGDEDEDDDGDRSDSPLPPPMD